MPDESLAAPVAAYTPVAAAACRACGTELAPSLASCPACHALVHKERLEALAAEAEAAERDGNAAGAAERWREALALLPPGSQQYSAVGDRLRAAAARADGGASGSGAARAGRWGILGAVVLFALGKGKLLLLGLTKLKTLFSMLAFLGVYWSMWGWAFALGMVLSIYVHEMGHVAALRRLGIRADAPLFIPGVGALVMLKEHPADARQDAEIGLAGPTWGLAAALAALGLSYVTGSKLLGAVAHAGAFLNLFNLIPVWQLDGARGFHALSRPQRWAAAGAIVVAWWLSGQKILFLLLLAAGFQCFRPAPREHHTPTLLHYVALLALLSALSMRSVAG